MPEPVSAVLLGDGQPEESGGAKARAEFLVPLRQPGVDAGFPAELRAVSGKKLP